jgi:fatty-acyl-CoA synthase
MTASSTGNRSPEATLHRLLRGQDEEVFLISEAGQFTFGEMRCRSNSIAKALKMAGLEKGDRLAVWLPNGPDWVALVLACSRVGVCLVSLNTKWGPKEVGDVLVRTASKGVVVSLRFRNGSCIGALRSVYEAGGTSLKLVITDSESPEPVLAGVNQSDLASLAGSSVEWIEDGDPSSDALILATSGTTSQPKLVVHTQESLTRHAADVANLARIDATCCMLLAIPVCGAYGYTSLISALQSGARLVMVEAFDPGAAALLIREFNVTHLFGTNDMLDKLLDVVPEPRPFPSLRMFGYAAFVPALDELPARAEARGVFIRAFYGMSELMAAFAAQPVEAPLEQRALAGGRPASTKARVSIRDPETGGEVAVGELGELVVETPNRLRCYLGDPIATRNAYTVDGFFRTGDLACASPDGGFNFVSRMGDVLRIGGYLVAPAEIEDVLAKDSSFQNVQVVAVQTQQGVRPVAFVVMQPGRELDEEAAIRRCRNQLAIYKVPVRVVAIQELPMVDGPNGRKVQRSALRELALTLFKVPA